MKDISKKGYLMLRIIRAITVCNGNEYLYLAMLLCFYWIKRERSVAVVVTLLLPLLILFRFLF